jgi:uncharacterized protein (TIGR03032 family)
MKKPKPESTPLEPSDEAGGDKPKLEVTFSRHFASWLAEENISLAFTTYQASKVFLIGLQPNDRMSIFERTFQRCMGLWADADSLYLSSAFQVWRLRNALDPGQNHDGYDRLYIPQMAWTTGDLDVHDLAVDDSGRVVFVNTLFGCLATLSETHSFVPLWQPPFVSRLAAEDRCHLNGLAMENGQPRYVTAVAASDVADGWRDHRKDGGVLIDVTTNETVVGGLSMPHSPRLNGGTLWMLDSGRGYLGSVDVKKGTFNPLTFCPGYLRGLAFHGKYALVGLSKPRERTFTGLDLDDNLTEKKAEPRCGVFVIDMETGDVVNWMRIEGFVSELFDVAVLPGVRRPAALGVKSDQIRHTVTVGEATPLQPSPMPAKKPARKKTATSRAAKKQ